MSYFHAGCFELWRKSTGRVAEFAHLRRKWKAFTQAEREAFECIAKGFADAMLTTVLVKKPLGIFPARPLASSGPSPGRKRR